MEQKDSTSRETYDFVIIPDNKRIHLVFAIETKTIIIIIIIIVIIIIILLFEEESLILILGDTYFGAREWLIIFIFSFWTLFKLTCIHHSFVLLSMSFSAHKNRAHSKVEIRQWLTSADNDNVQSCPSYVQWDLMSFWLAYHQNLNIRNLIGHNFLWFVNAFIFFSLFLEPNEYRKYLRFIYSFFGENCLVSSSFYPISIFSLKSLFFNFLPNSDFIIFFFLKIWELLQVLSKEQCTNARAPNMSFYKCFSCYKKRRT